MIRLFNTKRGLLAILAFATIWFIILYYFVSAASDIIASPTFEGMASQVFGALGVSALLEWDVAEFSIYWLVAVYFFPMFTILACSDQLCSDKQRGTLRFITLRVTRLELILGRYIGQVFIISILMLMTILATSILASVRNIDLLYSSLTLGFRVWLELLVVVLPFIALTSMLNAFVSSAKLTIVFSILFFGLGPLLLAIIKYQFGQEFYLNLLFPGEQIGDIFSQTTAQTNHYFLPLMQTTLLLILSYFAMKRESI